MEDDDNEELMAEVFQGEIIEVLHSFQKDKIPGSDGWMIEFYLGFYDLLGADIL